MRLLLFALVLLSTNLTFAAEEVYTSIFDCSIDPGAYDAPTTLVHPKVSIVRNKNFDQFIKVTTDVDQYINIKPGSSVYSQVIDGTGFSGDGVDAYITNGIERPPARAGVLFEKPKLKYDCTAAAANDVVIFNALKAEFESYKVLGGQFIVIEKRVGGLACFGVSLSERPYTYMYICDLEKLSDSKAIYESLNVKAMELGSVGSAVHQKTVGRLECTEVSVINPEVEPRYGCKLSR